MLKSIALVVALATTVGVAGAQATSTVSKSTVKTGTVAKSGTPRRTRRMKKVEGQADLQKEAKITEAAARATALKEVPNGTVKAVELEREHGKLIYSYDISVAGKTGIDEVAVNAIDGSVVSHGHETPKMEKKEAAQEAKEKKTKK
ncbi:MAG: PepSY domain-containing protein [Gemmatimonadaceae bacterium]